MKKLSEADSSADIACTLQVNDMRGRMNDLQTLVGHRLLGSVLDGDKLRIRLDRAGDDELEAKVTAWAEVEKGCCAFLGFALESEPDAVVLEIAAPPNAIPTLDAIEWIAQSAGARPA